MKETKITFRLDHALKVKFDVYCAENQVTKAETLTLFIEELIKESERQKLEDKENA